MSIVSESGSLTNDYSNFIAVSRYARWMDDEGRRETWTETVGRYVGYMSDRLGDKIDKETVNALNYAIVNQHVMPSMRALMTSGPALDRENIAGFNCSFIAVDHIRAFDESLYILMNGTGLGFDVQQRHVEKLPVIAEQFFDTDTTIVVHDSKLGWAKAYKELISLLVQGHVPKWDMTRVRPAGARLKTFGGRASGPEPLDRLFDFTVKTFKQAAGRQLKPIEAHDIMCKIAEVVVVGGVRRSALLSQSDLGDFDMAKAKSGNWWENNPQRALSNNSAVYYSKPSFGQFLEEWKNLYESKSGERGIVNMDGIRKHTSRFGRRDANKIVGKNPCVTADTWVMTADGSRQVKDLIGKEFDVIVNSGSYKNVSGGFVYTGNKQVYAVTTVDGYSVKATADHKILTERGWVEVKNLNEDDYIVLSDNKALKVGDYDKAGYAVGNLIGDGTFSDKCAYVAVWDEDGSEPVKSELLDALNEMNHRSDFGFFKTSNQHRAGHKAFTDYVESLGVVRGNKVLTDEIENQSLEFQAGVLRGYFDADGHVEGVSSGSGVTIRLSSINFDNLVRAQRMLQRFGIKSSIRDMHPDGRECFGGYLGKRSYRLIISGADTKRFMSVIGFSNTAKHEKYHANVGKFYRKQHSSRLASIDFVGFEDVFDVTVDEIHAFDANGIIVHNCAEINLRSAQFCNLTEVVIYPDDTREQIRGKVVVATILGTYQATLTDFSYLRPIWKKNTEEERLLGVSLTGVYGHPLMNGSQGTKELADFLDGLRELAVETNAYWANKLGINPSAAITTIKPSGTVSQLVGVSSGLHPWYSEYYIRTVRGDNKDPLTRLMKDEGIPNEPDVMKPNDTTVFSFPVKAPHGAVVSSDLTAIEHLEMYKLYREHWTEHDVSITVNVREDEWGYVGAWVYENFDHIGGVSFLPASDHTYQQAPYQPVSQEDYNIAVAKMPKSIDWVNLSLYELEDATTGAQELACVAGPSGDGCEVVDLTK